MKYFSVCIFFVIFLLSSTVSFSVLSSDLEENLFNVKNGFSKFSQDVLKSFPLSEGFESEFVDSDYFCDVFDYLEEMNREYPEKLNGQQQEYLNYCVADINSFLDQKSQYINNRGIEEFNDILTEKTINIIENIILRDNNLRSETATVNVESAVMRKGPGKNYKVIAYVAKNDKIRITKKNNGWYYGEYIGHGIKGYISYRVINVSNWNNVPEEGSASNNNHSNNNSHVNNNSNANHTDNKVKNIIHYAKGAVGKSNIIYGVHCYTSTTLHGRLACAAVVSSILKKSGCKNRIEVSNLKLRSHLIHDLNWKEIRSTNTSRYKRGDVCFWRKRMTERTKHVGIIVSKDNYGNWWTVDNSSSRLKVLKRPMKRREYPYVFPVVRCQ